MLLNANDLQVKEFIINEKLPTRGQLMLQAVSCEKDKNRTMASSNKGDVTGVPNPVPSINSGG